jgi:D-Tyr-tRNAtyr deacylase
MRSVVQRVEKAFIFIGEKEISRINRGLLVFLGVRKRGTGSPMPITFPKRLFI